MFIVFPRLRLRLSVTALPAMLLLLWCEGVAPFAVLVLSAAVHEFGHILAMRSLGYRLRRVDILPMGALIVCPEGIPHRDEFIIAVSGPLASLFSALTASIVFALTRSPFALYASLINLTLALFNLMPIKKLDGGKALSSFIFYKCPHKQNETAERICSAASVFSKLLFMAVAAFVIAVTGFNFGVLLLSVTLLIQLFKD